MKRKYIIISILIIALIPYVVSIFTYRGSAGYLGRIDGIQYNYVMVDRSHYQSPKILVYPEDAVNSVTFQKLNIAVDGEDIPFGKNKVLLLSPDKSFIELGWNKDWFITSTKFSSGIYGILGPVPHFKDYQIEQPDSKQFKDLIEQYTTH